jgi:hypothetical protein
MSRLAIAKQLIQDNDYQTAVVLLEKEERSEKAFEWLSYLYRLNDRYEQENSMLTRAIQQFAGNAYFQKRQQWNALSNFDKRVARQALHLPFNPVHTPSQETLDQMCFVTMGSKENFDWVVEMLESLKATRKYNDFPVCFLDVGLLDTQKDYLVKNFNIHCFIEALKECPIKLQAKPDQPSVYSYIYPFMNDMIQDFKYIFFIESDIWVQDDRFIDLYVWLCEKQGFAKGCYNTGLFCANLRGNFFQNWQTLFNVYRQKNPQDIYAAERMGEMAHQQMKLSYASVFDPNIRHNGFLFSWALPAITPHSNVLVDVQYMQPMSTIHIASQCEFVRKTGAAYFPMQVLQAPFNGQQFQQHLQISQAMLKDGFQNVQIPADAPLASIRYRVYPWKDKPEIKELLTKEILCLDA